MTIVRYEPWAFVGRLQRQLDRALGEVADSATVSWLPRVDIHEEAERFVVVADLPGVEAKNIDVTLEKGVLTIRGNRALETREDKNGYRRVERVSGAFFRRFTLPDTADSQSVKARFTNGVLEVAIPKQAQVLPRRISVEAA